MIIPPDKKIIRKIRFPGDQDGIINRYFRERGQWDVHLQNSRRFILDSFHDRPVRSVGILGSGWLLDVPLEELSERYDRVLLLDIHHPVEVRHKVNRFSNVVLQETDLTGGAVIHCWNLRQKMKKRAPVSLNEGMTLEIPELIMEPDALVSLNILNQLNGILLDFLKADKYFQQPDTERFSKTIQDFHISWITGKPGCILTDTAEHNYNRKGERTTKPLLYTRLPEGFRNAGWTWSFDTGKTYHPQMLTELEIRAIEW
ncbi:MAG: hypothetical protein JXR52_01570 [Bacteroidales bacterium]|nr:hypothetical protein [Bacteroidales bacterium]